MQRSINSLVAPFLAPSISSEKLAKWQKDFARIVSQAKGKLQRAPQGPEGEQVFVPDTDVPEGGVWIAKSKKSLVDILASLSLWEKHIAML